MMQIPKARYAFALLVPALLALSISEAAAQKQSANTAAARAECVRQANEAAINVSLASPSASAERNSRGVAAYRMRQTKRNPPLMQCRDTAAASFELQPICL
jgi:hypothetical protein